MTSFISCSIASLTVRPLVSLLLLLLLLLSPPLPLLPPRLFSFFVCFRILFVVNMLLLGSRSGKRFAGGPVPEHAQPAARQARHTASGCRRCREVHEKDGRRAPGPGPAVLVSVSPYSSGTDPILIGFGGFGITYA